MRVLLAVLELVNFKKTIPGIFNIILTDYIKLQNYKSINNFYNERHILMRRYFLRVFTRNVSRHSLIFFPIESATQLLGNVRA